MPWTVGLSYFSLIPLAFAQYVPSPRWAQATASLGNIVLVHGGLSDPYDSYSYTSAPAISDLLLLDLSTSFGISTPPWNLLSANSSPALAWHTFSAFNTTNLLLFGGQPGPNSQTVLTTLNDSATLLSVTKMTDPNFSVEPESWASEPIRRIRHAASTINGKVYITGGEKADGSGNAFSEHYVFDPLAAEFSHLPSNANSPPDIYGHSSLVLSDSRLVVLGGYCASCGQLVPLNTIWSLDTHMDDSNWELLVVSNSSLPTSRREFAAVSLPDGNILIHGGADAALQQTYSDGWILDTGTTPMTWKSVEALSQIGARKNHFAVQAGGLVLFGFGYGSSAPASASIFVYDPASSTMTSSFSAPPNSTPTHQSLSHPTQTGFAGSPDSGVTGNTGTRSANTPLGQATSSSPSGSQGTNSGPGSSQTLAIALGTTFGFLGLVSGAAVVYFVKRKHNGNGSGRFVLLGGDLEDKGGNAGSASGIVTTAGDNRASRFGNVLAYIGFSRGHRDQHRPRRDMFADEDTRSFTWGSRLMMTHREGSDVTGAWSLRSMGAMVRGMMSREPSTSGTGGDRSDGLDRIAGDRDELIASEKSTHDKRVREESRGRSGGGRTYADPFADPPTEDDYPWLDLRPGVLERDEEYDGPVGRDISLEDYDLTLSPLSKIPSPITFPLRTLSPLKQVTHTSTLNQSNPLCTPLEPSHLNSPTSASEPKSPISPITLRTFYPPSLENSSCHPPLSQTMHRSNSWWARFAKTSLLDRRGSVTSNNSKPLVFRDPNPAPPLSVIEEASTSKHSPTEPGTPPRERHTRSIASSHSMRTANTESAERLGGNYDVVQRALSEASGSRHTLASSTLETAATSTFIESEKKHGLLAVNRISDATGNESILSHSSSFQGSVSSLPPQTPVSASLTKTIATGLNTRSRSPLAKTINSAMHDNPSSPLTSPTANSGSEILQKVRAYERRLSQDLESQFPSPPSNTRKREEVPSRSRPTIKYGLAPRASLYVANPDAEYQDPS